MGDIIHTLPALTDAMCVIPNIQFDWVIEERFQSIPTWHPAVRRVIPIALRKWRKQGSKNPIKMLKAIKDFRATLNSESYDLVIDAQGLLKSALISSLVKAPSAGYQSHCVREKSAAYFYQKKYSVSWQQHAVERIRDLFSQALYYPKPESMPDYGVDKARWLEKNVKPYVLFFHGTTWANKHWPENYWKTLTKLLSERKLNVKLSWGNQQEYERSVRIAEHGHAEVLSDLSIEGLMPVIANATAVVAVDTGLCHLASALNIPTVALFGPTDPEKTGLLGEKQINLAANFACSPCLKRECHFKGEGYDEWPACFMTLLPYVVMNQLVNLNIGEYS